MSSASGGRRTRVPTPVNYATLVVVRDEVVVNSWSLAGAGPPDAATVDELARLYVVVRRLGYSVRLRDVSADLRRLLDLCGLSHLFGVGSLRVEMVGEAECGEQLCIHEVVEPDDPVT
jgi:hypothetical protein